VIRPQELSVEIALLTPNVTHLYRNIWLYSNTVELISHYRKLLALAESCRC